MRFRFSIIAPLAALVVGGLVAWTGGVAAPRSGTLFADKRPSAIPVIRLCSRRSTIRWIRKSAAAALRNMRGAHVAPVHAGAAGGVNAKVAVTC